MKGLLQLGGKRQLYCKKREQLPQKECSAVQKKKKKHPHLDFCRETLLEEIIPRERDYYNAVCVGGVTIATGEF